MRCMLSETGFYGTLWLRLKSVSENRVLTQFG